MTTFNPFEPALVHDPMNEAVWNGLVSHRHNGSRARAGMTSMGKPSSTGMGCCSRAGSRSTMSRRACRFQTIAGRESGRLKAV